MSATMGRFAPWQGCYDCLGGPQPGARALLAYWLEWSELGSSMGIYNCRNVRGGASRSIHSCGRAVDLGVPVNDAGHAEAYQFLTLVGPHLIRLGIQLAIFDRTYGSSKNPWPTYYGGAHPHRDHIHMELTPTSGSRLTLATLRSVLGTRTTRTGDDDVVPDGDRLKDVQEDLNWIRDHSKWVWPELKVDGVFGGQTLKVLDAFRKVWALRARGERPNTHDLNKIERTIHEIKEHDLHQ